MIPWRLKTFVVIVAPALLLSVDAFRLGDLDEASEELAQREVSQALAGIMKEMMHDKALQKLADRAVEAEMQGKRMEDKILRRKNEQQLLKEIEEDEARRQEELSEEERRQETQGFEAFVKAYGQTISAKKSGRKEQGKHEHNSFRKESVSLHDDADADDEKNNKNKERRRRCSWGARQRRSRRVNQLAMMNQMVRRRPRRMQDVSP